MGHGTACGLRADPVGHRQRGHGRMDALIDNVINRMTSATPSSDGTDRHQSASSAAGQPCLSTIYHRARHGRRKRRGRRGRVPAVRNLGGDVPPDSRIKWPKSGVFRSLGYFGGMLATCRRFVPPPRPKIRGDSPEHGWSFPFRWRSCYPTNFEFEPTDLAPTPDFIDMRLSFLRSDFFSDLRLLKTVFSLDFCFLPTRKNS